MDLQTLVNLCVGIVVPSLLAVIARSNAARKALEDADTKLLGEITEFRVKAAETYVTHVQLGDIKATLIRIEGKLDLKQDRV